MMATKTKQVVVELHLNLNDEPVDLNKKWPWASDSVDSITATNLLQYLKPDDRIHFVNEICRVLKPGMKATIQVPYWCSNQAYADLAAEWPPISEGWFFFLNKEWRETNSPKEKRYTCDFDTTWGYTLHPMIAPRNLEYQQHAITFWKEAGQGLCATMIKR